MAPRIEIPTSYYDEVSNILDRLPIPYDAVDIIMKQHKAQHKKYVVCLKPHNNWTRGSHYEDFYNTIMEYEKKTDFNFRVFDDNSYCHFRCVSFHIDGRRKPMYKAYFEEFEDKLNKYYNYGLNNHFTPKELMKWLITPEGYICADNGKVYDYEDFKYKRILPAYYDDDEESDTD